MGWKGKSASFLVNAAGAAVGNWFAQLFEEPNPEVTIQQMEVNTAKNIEIQNEDGFVTKWRAN